MITSGDFPELRIILPLQVLVLFYYYIAESGSHTGQYLALYSC